MTDTDDQLDEAVGANLTDAIKSAVLELNADVKFIKRADRPDVAWASWGAFIPETPQTSFQGMRPVFAGGVKDAALKIQHAVEQSGATYVADIFARYTSTSANDETAAGVYYYVAADPAATERFIRYTKDRDAMELTA